MIKLVFTILLLITSVSLYAQKRFIMKADSLVSAFYFNSGFDTNYVSRPEKRFMAALHPDFSSIGIMINKNDNRANFYTNLSNKSGIYATYRGYGFGYSIKPNRGRKNDKEFNFRFFCRRFGIETDFCRANSFSAEIYNNDTSVTLQRGDIDFGMKMFSVYYVFNNKKFSFPAAFDKSYTQIHSCGSVLLGSSYTAAKMQTEKGDFNITSRSVGFGAGYGYNYVTKKRFLFHASVIPTFVLWEKNQLETSSQRHRMKYKVTDLCIWGRAAASYNFKRIFVGTDYVLYSTILGDYNEVSTSFVRNITRFFAGFWF